ncbi:hypothetical protein NX722_14200 [Endozoicomonas gorgoniicola]|uniref:Uncharacterized protein n=1 Tax=Endozoicomonas gorgoniicola TaxID=1234144 RepID=A0ABT3MWK6_9GAMM|nr:hypothetical protein [Endozoicomonas gorgoniicola]MCW7553762.1 hypothetical protein [Endozoicomonas gorgoniicola]
MGDMAEDFKLLKKLNKERKQRNLENASKEGWHLHTEYHWSRTLNGKRLDYWPSRNKFMYEGKVMVGDVEGFIRNREGA